MKIYDISQELFSSEVFLGDSAPKYERVRDFDVGDEYSLTEISLCVHNGTHIDAPRHFIKDGKTVDETDLEKLCGKCRVISFDGIVSAEKLAEKLPCGTKRVCIKGGGYLTDGAAKVIAERGISLVGVEAQSVTDPQRPMEGHKILLSHEIVILEGIRLGEVEDGEYFLFALPLKLGGAEGAPCRAVLIEE